MPLLKSIHDVITKVTILGYYFHLHKIMLFRKQNIYIINVLYIYIYAMISLFKF